MNTPHTPPKTIPLPQTSHRPPWTNLAAHIVATHLPTATIVPTTPAAY